MTDLPEQYDGDDQDTTGAPDASTPAATPPPSASATPPPSGSIPPSQPTPPPVPATTWPQQGTSADSRNWAVGAHLSAIAASIIGLAVLGPLLVWLIKKDEDRFVAEHGREALNFQLTWLIGGFVGVFIAIVLTFLTIGLGAVLFIPVAFGFFVAWVVFMVKGAMAASRGEYYRYPLTIRMVS